MNDQLSDPDSYAVEGRIKQHIEQGDMTPWTFKGIFANAALGIVRIAAALERIAKVMEDKRESKLD